jgi:hypothetical protein
MNTLGLVFLGIIALCGLIQAGFFLAATIAALRAAARLDALVDRAEREWPELGRRLTDVTAQIAEASVKAQAAAERTHQAVEKVAAVTDRASHAARTAAQLPLKPLRTGSALWQALRRAVAVYRQPDRQPVR